MTAAHIAPDTKYKMLWGGEWRPVCNMFEGNEEVWRPTTRVTAAVLFIGAPDFHKAVPTTPGDIVRRDGRPPNPRDWDVI